PRQYVGAYVVALIAEALEREPAPIFTTKSRGLMAVCGQDGDIDSRRDPRHGLFFNDTRFLERLTLRLQDQELLPVLASADGASSLIELTNPPPPALGESALRAGDIVVLRRRQLGRSLME